MGEGINRFASLLLLIMSDVSDGMDCSLMKSKMVYTTRCNVTSGKPSGKSRGNLDIQVFATTHSLEMIRAAYEAFSEDKKLDEFRFHRLDRDRETGDIEAVTYNKRGLEAVAAFDFDFEVRG